MFVFWRINRSWLAGEEELGIYPKLQFLKLYQSLYILFADKLI